MSRLFMVFGLAVLIFATNSVGFCQVIAGCYPPAQIAVRPNHASLPAPPVIRTVQVDVPVPCVPVSCRPPMPCPSYPCAPPVCAPPPATETVQVRVEVRVRPEPCGQQTPDRQACRDYGALGPVIGMTAAIMSAPIRLLERMFPPLGWCAPPKPPCGPLGAPPHRGCPPAPHARFAPGCPTPARAPVPGCGPPMPVPAYQKCVSRGGSGR